MVAVTQNWAPVVKALAPKSPPMIFNGFVAALPAAFMVSLINTSKRQAHFLAQCIHESAGLSRLTENLNYSVERIKQIYPKLEKRAAELAFNPVALGNAAYANRYGNGDETSGDGYRFRGRGFFQHTFRANYKELADKFGEDLVGNPDLLLKPDLAVRAATHYFTSRGCLKFADQDDIEKVTLRINGGTNGLADRRSLKDRCLKLLGDPPSSALIA